ncbi:MAG: 2-oxoglutarate dehydrogenase E1 component [Chlamydiae bacterium]|nr:2-oxoglutarate dehydrogenase E1 component [Chlamydiota bacterium]
MEKKALETQAFSNANFGNYPFIIEELYEKFLQNPESVDPSWRTLFAGYAASEEPAPAKSRTPKTAPREEIIPSSLDLRLFDLINAYRTYGHLYADFNPLEPKLSERPELLDPKRYYFSEEDLSKTFPTMGFLNEKTAPLQKIITALEETYCGKIGIEYMGLERPQIEKWLQERIEPGFCTSLSAEEKTDIMHWLSKAEFFESFLHTKYVGQKRFSLEGGETLIPMLDFLLEKGHELGLKEVIVGMAHRGRLNVLANILGKSYEMIFHEFEDYYAPDLLEGTGDVKYHKGFEGVLKLSDTAEVHITLAANPSHLESVDPVVCGMVRARQDALEETRKREVLPLLIHGDAAIAGQGVVYETLQLNNLEGYETSGTIHIVINNQIGFTATPTETRSTRYCTDIAKSFAAPVFHVNAEDPEGCVYAAMLAIEIRQKFGCDVFIDLNCYRKYGHNESDEPNFTQPLTYSLIKKKKPIREIYLDRLIQEGILTKEEAITLEGQFRESLQQALSKIKDTPPKTPTQRGKVANRIKPVITSVPSKNLQELAEKFCQIPEGFHLHPKIARLGKDRLAMVQGDPKKPSIDWGMAEHLAYGSLLNEGVAIRLSGQDCARGTFSHRQAVWVDQESQKPYFPLDHLKGTQGKFQVFNSPLSEFAVLGFDFGYSVLASKSLVIWEAQFGDFCNGAQIIIDQYLSASEQKWNLSSRLVLLLPHGYEGQGPEHSSARMERFLQLCGHANLQVVNCSTPAQFFHVLRRQMHAPVSKPLVVFTPKALLRHPECTSSLDDFVNFSFQTVLDDVEPIKTPKKLLFCSGKVFYDLIAERKKRNRNDIVIIRIEQLYPLDEEKVRSFIEKYKGVENYVFVQEEHKNMGSYFFLSPLLEEILQKPIRYIGRGVSASPAAGSYQMHRKEGQHLLDEVFG